MRFKLNSYAVKNASAPGTKAKKLKASTKFNVNQKRFGGVKDNRKYEKDKTLSEAEKIARRMDLENMKNRVKSHTTVQSDKLFSDVKDNKDWALDPMLLKVQQLGRLDEGLDEASDEESEDEGKKDSSRYFADGKTIKKKKTLEDVIHESKVRKAEKSIENEKNSKIAKHVNETFSNDIRHILPKLGASLKAKFGSKLDETKSGLSTQFDADFESMQMAELPQTRDVKVSSITEGNAKKNDKLVSNKVDKLRERLKSAGIVFDDGTEMNLSDFESETEEHDSEDSDGDDNENSESESEEDKESEEDNDDGEDGEDNEGAESEDGEDNDDGESEDEVEENDEEIDVSKVDTISQLKSYIKGNKRRIEDTDDGNAVKKMKADTDDGNAVKKIKADTDKTDIDCLRVLMQMDELRREIMLVLSSGLSSPDMSPRAVVKKVILASLLQESLRTNKPNSYSPELIRLLRSILHLAASDSEHWLSVTEDHTALPMDRLLGICTEEIDSPLLPISTVFHAVRLSTAVMVCNMKLPTRHQLFPPFEALIDRLPTSRYPTWLTEEVDKCREHIGAAIDGSGVSDAMMRVKRQFKIVELLEADIEDKFDSRKDVTKTLKKKVKSERKALRKDIKLETKVRVMQEVAEGRRDAEIRTKKTLAIINNIHQI